ncbi:hypothetical protein [Eisenibacter elegans]|uniref:hypothetical protein n=1 Tax=Eisenibacter elegans TaxID=997 RepID=UPI001377AC6A|nr:hypothetical protein [Eisenibacter elegans]
MTIPTPALKSRRLRFFAVCFLALWLGASACKPQPYKRRKPHKVVPKGKRMPCPIKDC